MKKLLTIALALVMVFALAVPVWAEDDPWTTITKEPTCSTEGYTCDYNTETGWTGNYVYTPALGHKYDAVVWEGDSGYITCNVCGWGGYTWERITVDPTCVADGYTLEHNKETGWIGNQVVTAPALGHLFDEAIWDGYGWYIQCERCGWAGYVSYAPQSGTVEPTCTLEGYDFTYDYNSDQYWYSNYVPALGHAFGEATWDGDGWWAECERCGWAGYLSYEFCSDHDYVLSVVASSMNLQNNTNVKFTVTAVCAACEDKIVVSSTYNVGQKSGTRSYAVGDYMVTIVVNQNNMITSVTVK